MGPEEYPDGAEATMNQESRERLEAHAPRTILMIEDDGSVRKVMKITCEHGGYQVVEAADGRAAVKAMEAGSPDLILHDLVLPDIDGFTLVQRLRALPGGKDIPIIALSGSLMKVEQARHLTSGFTDFLLKPVTPSHLLRVIGWYLPRDGRRVVRTDTERRVLLVDDDSIQIELVKRIFERVGFVVTTTRDGSEALEVARELAPDAIVSDVRMPGLDGFRFCLALHRDPRLASIPVILTTGDATPEDAAMARQVGARALVTRTPNHKEVVDAVIASIGGGAGGATAEGGPENDALTPLIRELEHHEELGATFQATPEGRLVAVNRELAQLLGGMDPDELVAAHPDFLEIFVHPEAGQRFLRSASGPTGETGFEAQIRRLDGRVVWISARSHALRDEDGLPCLLEGTIEEISERLGE
jgi:CheY-like chemotaxis protein